MKTNQTNLHGIIGMSRCQYIVPLFQRTYSWGKKEWQDLWDDILELHENDVAKNHFLGSIVTIPVGSASQNVTKYVLIDGQQRLTTLFILLILIRDHAMKEEYPAKSLADQINEDQLINKHSKGGENDKYKLLPTQQDRPAFQTLINRQSISPELEKTQIIECYYFFEKCYRFFEKRVKKIDVEKLSQIISNQLTVVSIELDPDENPHLVFESLNARGKPLSQADLIRNYFFMRIQVDEQKEIFDRHWLPMQNALGDDLTECIRHYLMAIKATDVKKTEVYITLKNSVAEVDVLDSLKEIATYAIYYQKILHPEHEPTPSIQHALKRIERIKVTVAYPFLLKCYHDYQQGNLSEVDFCKVLHFIENMVIRRHVCKLPSNALNKVFPGIYRHVKLDYSTGSNHSAEFIKGVAQLLQGKGYPNDEEFRDALTTTNLYSQSGGRERTKLILESLESSHQHKEKVDFEELSVEHIMPQTITEWWQNHLGEEWGSIHELYLHTLGNLTLTGYNSELSNKSFPGKQKGLAQSHLELNRHFASLKEWKKEQIERRAEQLADLALTVWSYFGDNQQPASTRKRQEVTGTKPSRLVIKDEEFVVKTWRDVLEKTLNFWIKEEPEQFESLVAEYPKSISKNANIFKQRSTELSNGYHVGISLSAEHIYRFCQQVMGYFDYSKDDWRVDYQ
jgi:uncharacterized protein with ParB-like and HNH nuclease domain